MIAVPASSIEKRRKEGAVRGCSSHSSGIGRISANRFGTESPPVGLRRASYFHFDDVPVL